MDYDYLITKKKLEEEDTFENFLNEKTEFRADALADRHLSVVKKGTSARGGGWRVAASMDSSLMPRSLASVSLSKSSQATSSSSSAAASSSATPWARTAR